MHRFLLFSHFVNNQMSEGAQKKQPKRRMLVYFSSLFGAWGPLGLIAAFQYIKKPLSQELGIEEGELGLLDGLSFLTRSILLVVFIAKPERKPKRAFMLSAVILIVLFSAVPGSPYLGNWGFPVLLVAMILSGFSRAFNFVPMVIINTEFDATGKDSFKVEIWQTIFPFGEIIAFISCGLMLNVFHWNWKVCILVCMATYFFIALGLYLTADEIDMSKEDQNESFSKSFQEVKQLISNSGNLFFLLQVGMLISFHVSFLWLPYYFTKRGFQAEAPLLSSLVTLLLPVGAYLFNFTHTKYPASGLKISYIMQFANILCIGGLSLAHKVADYAYVYGILLSLSGILEGGPLSYHMSVEMKNRGQSPRELYLLTSIKFLFYQILTFLIFITIGYLMQIDLNWFFYTLLILLAIITVLNISRNHIFPSTLSQPQSHQDQNNHHQMIQEDQT